MINNKINIFEILDNIYLSIKIHYKNHDLDIDKLIRDDKEFPLMRLEL